MEVGKTEQVLRFLLVLSRNRFLLLIRVKMMGGENKVPKSTFL